MTEDDRKPNEPDGDRREGNDRRMGGDRRHGGRTADRRQSDRRGDEGSSGD